MVEDISTVASWLHTSITLVKIQSRNIEIRFVDICAYSLSVSHLVHHFSTVLAQEYFGFNTILQRPSLLYEKNCHIPESSIRFARCALRFMKT